MTWDSFSVVLTTILYMVSAVLFIRGIKLLGKADTARKGNQISSIGMLIAVVTVFFESKVTATLHGGPLHNGYLWAIVALVPLLGVIAYCLLRPPLLQIDRDEQELEVALKQRELMKYGECASCGYPVEADYVMCPNCHQRLKNLCPTCHHALDPSWSVCPYCTTPIGAQRQRQR